MKARGNGKQGIVNVDAFFPSVSEHHVWDISHSPPPSLSLPSFTPFSEPCSKLFTRFSIILIQTICSLSLILLTLLSFSPSISPSLISLNSISLWLLNLFFLPLNHGKMWWKSSGGPCVCVCVCVCVCAHKHVKGVRTPHTYYTYYTYHTWHTTHHTSHITHHTSQCLACTSCMHAFKTRHAYTNKNVSGLYPHSGTPKRFMCVDY